MQKAFTMIELIFIIVIIGILSVFAISKLNATRDDAKATVEITKIVHCIEDIASNYTARTDENTSSSFCKNIFCAKIDLNNTNDGNISVKFFTRSDGKPYYCDIVKKIALKKHLEGNYSFGGNNVK